MTREEKLLSYFQKTDSSLSGRSITVMWDKGKDIGYSIRNLIGLNPEHELTKSAEYPEVFLTGIDAHEVLHVLLTDSATRKELTQSIESSVQKRLFSILSNVVEDQAIENFAETQFGGMLLSSLQYAIAHTYKSNPGVKSEKPLSEYINALIQFGDGGFIANDFQFEDAKEAFIHTVKEVFDISWDGNSTRRQNRCFDLCQSPYIQKLIDEPLSEQMKSLQSTVNDMQSQGKSISDGESSGQDLTDEAESDELKEKKADREDKLDAQLDDIGDSQETEGSTGASGGFEETDEKTSEETNAAGSNPSDNDGNEEGETSGLPESIKSAMEEAEARMQKALNAAKEVNKDLDAFVNDNRETKEQQNTESYDYSRPKLSDIKKAWEKIEVTDCLPDPMVPEYRSFISTVKRIVNTFFKKVQRIFEEDQDELEPSALTGRIDPYRYKSPARHRKVLRKMFDSTLKKEAAIQIAIDCSGSTGSTYKDKSYLDYEKEAAMIVSEAFSKIKTCKLNVTGFCFNGNVVHYHSLNWINNEMNRSRIMAFKPCGSNFDAYSINTLKEELLRQKQQHNLMLVFLDGLPNCPYSAGKPGIENNRTAVANAERDGVKVVGIGLGDVDERAFQKMFGSSYVIITELDELASKLISVILTTIKGW